MNEEARLIDDEQIARKLCVSRQWVRGQRFKKRHDLPHVLNIEPVMIGSLPRYRAEDFDQWIGSLNSENDGGTND
jgi:hypothetical protein